MSLLNLCCLTFWFFHSACNKFIVFWVFVFHCWCGENNNVLDIWCSTRQLSWISKGSFLIFIFKRVLVYCNVTDALLDHWCNYRYFIGFRLRHYSLMAPLNTLWHLDQLRAQLTVGLILPYRSVILSSLYTLPNLYLSLIICYYFINLFSCLFNCFYFRVIFGT